jgi:hypothetical protein
MSGRAARAAKLAKLPISDWRRMDAVPVTDLLNRIAFERWKFESSGLGSWQGMCSEAEQTVGRAMLDELRKWVFEWRQGGSANAVESAN